MGNRSASGPVTVEHTSLPMPLRRLSDPYAVLGLAVPGTDSELAPSVRAELTRQVLTESSGFDGLFVDDPVIAVQRLIVAGDWHGDGGAAAHVLHAAARAGARVVVQLGDFGLWPGRGGARYLDLVQRLAERMDVLILLVLGNHEDYPQALRYPWRAVAGLTGAGLDVAGPGPEGGRAGLRMARERIGLLPRGCRWTWSGTRFAAVGGATSIDVMQRRRGREWWAEEWVRPEEAEAVIAAAQRQPAADVLLCHDCPTGVIGRPPTHHDPGPVAGPAWRVASAHADRIAAIAAALEPRLIVHGHHHCRYDGTWAGPGRVAAVWGLDRDSTRTRNWRLLTVPAGVEQLSAGP